MSPQFESMTKMMETITQMKTRSVELYQEGEYGPCDDEMWRCGVEMESLESMMAANS